MQRLLATVGGCALAVTALGCSDGGDATAPATRPTAVDDAPGTSAPDPRGPDSSTSVTMPSTTETVVSAPVMSPLETSTPPTTPPTAPPTTAPDVDVPSWAASRDVLPTVFPVPTGEPCTTNGVDAAMIVTPDCVDPELAAVPYIDVDERRRVTAVESGAEFEYRYVHGGFTDTEVRFALYFPDDYRGRFFQSTYPTVGQEGASDESVAFAVANGAYVVSSNNAGGVIADRALGGYRANAAAAKFSTEVAATLYGADAPTRGYIYGASGGAYQTLGSAEKTDGVWAGSVPIVPGVPNSIPSFMSVQVLALRVLADDFADIVDALEPGGSGDPYATLDDDERAVLEEATRLGFPLHAWWDWANMRGGAFPLVVPAVEGIDPGYLVDFYDNPDYPGATPEVQAARVQFDTTVASVADDSIVLADTPEGFLTFADLVVTGGAAEGARVAFVSVDGDQVSLPDDADAAALDGLVAGDPVRIDNSFYIALSYYHRYQVPPADQYGWDQFRDDDGAPIYPQRPTLVGHILAETFGGVSTGDFNGKMIMLASVDDAEAYAWSADWYRNQAELARGDALGDDYRLWYTDNAGHTRPRSARANAYMVDYGGVVQQALLDLDDWVANGAPPPSDSVYEITDDTQVVLAPTAAERGGVQPVASLSATPGDNCDDTATASRTEVEAGESVALSLTAEVPPGTGEVFRVEWDFDTDGEYDTVVDLDPAGVEISVCEVHIWEESGTYFPVGRVSAARDGEGGQGWWAVIQNLDRARVVVS